MGVRVCVGSGRECKYGEDAVYPVSARILQWMNI